MATYHMRADGTAANKAAADGTGDASTFLDVAGHNGETFAADDVIELHDGGGNFTDAVLTPPTAGSVGQPITYQAATGESPVLSGADLVGTWTTTSASGGAGSDLLSDNFDDNDITDWESAVGGVAAANQQLETTISSGGTDRVRKSFTDDTEVWAQWKQTLASGHSGWGSGEDTQGGGLTEMAGYHHVLYVGMKHDGSNIVWYFRYGTDGSETSPTTTTSSVTVTEDVAHDVHIHWVASTGAGNDDGIAEVWIDGVQLLDLSGLDTDTMSTDGVLMGNNATTGTFDASIVIDDLDVGTTGSDPVIPPANTWQAALTTAPDGVFFDGTYGNEESALADLGTDKDWFHTGTTLYCTSTSDPDTRYTSPGVEATQRERIILLQGKDYVTIDGLTLRHSGDGTEGALYCNQSANATLTNLIIHDCFGYSGIHHEGALTDTGGVISYNTISYIRSGDADRGVGIQMDQGGSATIDNNTIHHNTDGGIKIGLWIGSSSVTISNNTCYQNGASGISLNGADDFGTNTASCIVEYNHCYDNGQIVADRYNIDLYKCGDDNIVRYNLCHGMNYISLDAGGIRIDAESGGIFGSGTLIYYNICYDERNGIHILGSDGVSVYNNVIYNSGITGLWSHGSNADANIFKNNIVHTSGSNHAYNQDATNSVFDYNLYYPDTGTPFNWNDTSYNFADWKTNSSQDGNSPTPADPLFVDAAAADFRLAYGSPCIDAGTDVGLTQDFAGNTVPK